jgi:hypothetical protein
MSLLFSSNIYYDAGSSVSTNNGDDLIFKFKSFMKSAGWTVPQSSDGLTLDQSGTDKITHANSGAGGMANQFAWFILREPASYAGRQREFLFYKNPSTWTKPSDGCYRFVVYSVGGFSTSIGFNSGSVTATNPPIAFDGLHLNCNSYAGWSNPTSQWGAMPANDTLNQLINTLSSSINMTVINGKVDYTFCASDTAPYFWYIFGRNSVQYTSTSTSVFICYDPLTGCDSSDGDQAMVTSSPMGTYISGIISNSSTNGNFNVGWHKYQSFSSKTDAINKIDTLQQSRRVGSSGVIGFTFTNLNGASNSSDAHQNPAYTKYTAQYPGSSKIRTIPAFYGGHGYGPSASPTSYDFTYIKGISSNIRYSLNPLYGNTLVDVNGSKDYLSLNVGYSYSQSPSPILIPWNGTSINF